MHIEAGIGSGLLWWKELVYVEATSEFYQDYAEENVYRNKL
jgi:hypothetical protein